MRIIGEKINGTLKHVKMAVEKKDALFIQKLAKSQEEAGAFWLDVNAGTLPESEPEDLAWLVRVVQEVSDLPLSLDSTNAEALKVAIKEAVRTPLINSISGEQDRIEGVLPIVRDHNCEVIVLAMDGDGIPESVEDRYRVIENIIKQTRKSGVSDDKLYIDPLVTAISTINDSGLIAFETMRKLRREFSDIHFTMGLSNISFGLPERSVVNKTFLALSMAAGLDSAIMDPLDMGLMETLITTELILGRDDYCQKYVKSFRAGLIGRARM